MTTKTIQDANSDQKSLVISEIDTKEIEKTFEEARDFRSIWEKITSPIDSIISETAKIIDKDPIMNVSDELESINKDVQGIYSEIINKDGTFMKLLKSIPVIWWVASKVQWKIWEASFNLKTVEWKIWVIFSWFDESYNSLNTSIDMQKKFLEAIEENLWKVVAYKDFLEDKIVEFKDRAENTTDEDEKRKMKMFIQNVEFFQTNLVVLIWNLDMARKRLEMRLDSATKLSLAMNSSRPIFKTLLSTALIETSSQKAIDASMKAMSVMWETIDKMSSSLTDKAIEWSKKAEEMASKPVLSTSQFVENVVKLKNHFDQIDDFREQVAKEAMEERKQFEEASKKLEDMKLLNSKTQEEFVAELNKADK